MTTLAGIDVSNWQGDNFPWASYRGKIGFAGIRISEGLGGVDQDAARNIAGARSIGAVPMGYHFLHANAPGAAQANAFMSRCKAAKLVPGDIMAVDVEQGGLDGWAPSYLWRVASDFMSVIHGHYGSWPVTYANISMAEAAPNVGQSPLWLANPSGTPCKSVGPWKVISFEQLGQVGIDTDVFYGDQAALAKLAFR